MLTGQSAAVHGGSQEAVGSREAGCNCEKNDFSFLSASLGPKVISEIWFLASFLQGSSGLGRGGGDSELTTGHLAYMVHDVFNTLQPLTGNQWDLFYTISYFIPLFLYSLQYAHLCPVLASEDANMNILPSWLWEETPPPVWTGGHAYFSRNFFFCGGEGPYVQIIVYC